MQGNTPTATDTGVSIDYWQVIKNRYGVILLTFLLILLTALVILVISPKKFKSEAVVEVHPPTSVNPFSGAATINPGALPTRNHLENEFEKITAPETLKMAAENANLAERWDANIDNVVDTLSGIVSTTPRRQTDFIEIEVLHSKANEAREIAEKVAEAYIARREAIEVERAEKQLAALDSELIAQSDLVQDARRELTVLIQQYGIPYFESQANPFGAAESIRLQAANKKLDDYEDRRNQTEIMITSLLETPEEDLIRHAAGLDLPENQVATYYKLHNDSNDQLKLLKAQGLGAKHPDYVAVQERANSALENAKKEVVSLKGVLKTQLALIKRTVENLKKVTEVKEQDTIELSLRQSNYTQAKEDYEQARDMLRAMKVQQQQARVMLKMPREPVTFHEKPKENNRAVSPKPLLLLGLGAGAGLIFGFGIAFLLEFMDTSVKSLEDVEKYLQVPVLAVIPRDVGVLHKQSGMSPDAEAYRILRTNIEFNRKNAEDNSITVVSGGAGEGKSTTLVNLAYVCAQGGYTTLMIDADLRRPRLHTFFDINNSVGLTNYLTTDLAIEDVILQTPVDNLYFLPSGILPADAAGILNSRRMSELLQDVKQRFDLVLVDSPPILGVSDASVLASEVDLTMVVVQHRKLPRNMLMRVKQAVENVGGQVIGVVLNNVDVRSDSQYQYYTSYYTYYAPSSLEETPTPQQMTPHQPSKPETPKTPSPASSNEDLY